MAGEAGLTESAEPSTSEYSRVEGAFLFARFIRSGGAGLLCALSGQGFAARFGLKPGAYDKDHKENHDGTLGQGALPGGIESDPLEA